jgi:hypothetical protein
VLAVAGTLVVAGCGPSTTTVDESETQSAKEYEAELEAEAAGQFRGDVNLSKPDAKKDEAGEAAPAPEEEPTGEKEE